MNFTQITTTGLPNGRSQAFALTIEGLLLTCRKVRSGASPAWSHWTPWSKQTPVLSQLAAGTLSDGRLQLFAVQSENGALLTCWMETADAQSPWSDWSSVEGSGSVVQADVAPLTQGGLRLFTVGATGQLLTCAGQLGSWEAWTKIPASQPVQQVAVAPLAEGGVQLFVLQNNGIQTCRAAPSSAADWSSWSAIPYPPSEPGLPAVPPQQAQRLAAAPLPGGGVRLFALNQAGRLLTSRLKAGTDWEPLATFPGALPALNLDVTGFHDRLELALIDEAGVIWSSESTDEASGRGWCNWTQVAFGTSLPVTMQPQQRSNWCWAAVATTTARFYQPSQPWTQESLVGVVLGVKPDNASTLPAQYNVAWYLAEALTQTGHFERYQQGPLSYEDTCEQVARGAPLGVQVQWAGGGTHFMLVTGYDAGDLVLVQNPWDLSSTYVPYDTLVKGFHGNPGNMWIYSYITKA
ncbi:C39 family peptidase [Archangium violaceum]|uniref:papain-like cysteine protease family protein n=1 Tax=Archangium violaceum TaxID=83451 RepID=UPI00194FA991|nr:papain-like cysteine protease family protein [Archangium violaceum]QRO01884.1 C39 family peptidase [Archangium violaceum]